MKPVEPIRTLELFEPLSQELLAVLDGLQPLDWSQPTACTPWNVKDVTAHLLGGNFGRLWIASGQSQVPLETPPPFDELLAVINRRNDEWVVAARRISPHMLIELLRLTDHHLLEHFRILDEYAPARAAVVWAGDTHSPNWFDIAREYTEKWLHQQHIRQAVRQSLLTSRQWLHPVLDTFLRGLPYTYRHIAADTNTSVTVSILGDSGGEWTLRREESGWELYAGTDPAANSRVILSQDMAWRLFTKDVRPDTIRPEVEIVGDVQTGAQVLELVAIMA